MSDPGTDWLRAKLVAEREGRMSRWRVPGAPEQRDEATQLAERDEPPARQRPKTPAERREALSQATTRRRSRARLYEPLRPSQEEWEPEEWEL